MSASCHVAWLSTDTYFFTLIAGGVGALRALPDFGGLTVGGDAHHRVHLLRQRQLFGGPIVLVVAPDPLRADDAHLALGGRGYSRTDMKIRDGEIYVLETNTIPGMTATSLFPQAAQAMGLEFPALLDTLIELALERE